MQPTGKQILYGACIGWFWSTMTRVPCASCMPSGTVMRRTFCSPSGSNSCTIATGMPFSSRPSLVTTQTCLLLVSGPLPQTFIHGEYISCGSPCAAWPGAAGAGCAGCAAGAAGLAAGFFGCASDGDDKAAASAATPIVAVSARPQDRPEVRADAIG